MKQEGHQTQQREWFLTGALCSKHALCNKQQYSVEDGAICNKRQYTSGGATGSIWRYGRSEWLREGGGAFAGAFKLQFALISSDPGDFVDFTAKVEEEMEKEFPYLPSIQFLERGLRDITSDELREYIRVKKSID